jgi:hypothetical protein
LEESSDVVTTFLNRVGNLGLLLIAIALLLGGLTGATVVHRLDRAASSPVASHQAKDAHKPSKNAKQSKRDLRNKHRQGNTPSGPNSAPGENSQHND